MIRFLTIGRVLYDKGFQELIDCASFFKERKESVEFQWLGPIDTDYSQYVKKEEVLTFHNKGIINYLGFHSNVIEYINKADCIILPSYHEGMSRVLMEALALSKPIITSNIPGCKETVIEGENGFLCEPRNSQSLIDAVEMFLNLTPEQRELMGKRSREYAERRFDVKNIINVYDALIKDILTYN